MKKIIAAIAFMLLCCLAQSQTKNFIDQPYIEVSGYADTLVVPDEIYIRIVISEKDTRDRVSVDDTEKKLTEGLKALGINVEKDFSTFDMGSNYRFYVLKKRDVIKSKQYILKVSDAVMTSKVFMLLEDLDISNSSIDRVSHSAAESIKNITRIRAVDNAKIKATALSKTLGQNIGPAIYINDNESAAANTQDGKNARFVTRRYETDKYKSETPKVEFEKIAIASIVNVKFILK